MNEVEDKKAIQMVRKINIYMLRCTNLYGAISLNDFFDVFTHYERAVPIDFKTFKMVVTAIARSSDYFVLHRSFLTFRAFADPESKNYDGLNYLIKQQKGKPRYLPSKKEFKNYDALEYYEPRQYAIALMEYVKNNRIVHYEQEEQYERDLSQLIELTRLNGDFSEYYQYIRDQGYEFSNEEQLKNYLALYMDTVNNCRHFENNGYTPRELMGSEMSDVLSHLLDEDKPEKEPLVKH